MRTVSRVSSNLPHSPSHPDAFRLPLDARHRPAPRTRANEANENQHERAPLRQAQHADEAYQVESAGLQTTRGPPRAQLFNCSPLFARLLVVRDLPSDLLHPNTAHVIGAAHLQFLDSKDDVAVEMPLPRVPEESRPLPMRARPSSKRERHEAHADAVWVDCFYYGFYLEKSKLPSFQASLRSQQQQQAQSGSSGPFMHMPPAAAAH